MNIEEVKAKALEERSTEVAKELTKKYKVLAKRQGQIDEFVAGWAKRVKEFEDAIVTADTPEKVLAVLAAHKFPANSIHFTPRQDD